MMKLDFFSVGVTAIVMPIAYLVIKRVRTFLKQNANKIMDALLWFAAKAFNRKLSRKASLRQYCRNGLSRSSTRYMLIPGKTQVVLETDSTFVSLRLKVAGRTKASHGEASVLTKNPRVQIIGDPGSGKSSLVKKMFRTYCEIGTTGLASQPGWKLPILIDLKNFSPPKRMSNSDTLGAWALDEIKKQVSTVHGYEMDQLFESHVTGNGVALLLDGLDEVAGEVYPKVAKALRALSGILENLSSGNAILITMRTQFHQQVSSELDEIFPVAYFVQPFSPADVYEFLNRWPHFERGRRSEEILRIASDLTDRPTVREMCTNPLVLSMYVSNDQSSSESTVVETRTAFYSQVVEELLVARRGRQLGLQARSLLLEQRETLLGRLAFANMCDTSQAANSLSWRAAVEGITDLMPGLTPMEAENKLRELAKETGIISEERRGETFRFIHLTFCEFFAAKESAEGRDDGWAELIDAHRVLSGSSHPQTRTRLVEVVPFAIAMLPRVRRQQALLDTASLGDMQVLGRCFLETQAYSHQAWDGYFATESSSLLQTSPQDWTEGWLLRLHLFNVILKDRERWSIAYGYPQTTALETLFGSLVGSDRNRLTRIFSSYVSVDAPAAFRLAKEVGVDLVTEQPELIGNNLSDPVFLDLLIGQFSASPHLKERLALIFSEAGLSRLGVAFSLALKDAPRELEVAVRDIPRRKTWFVGKPLESRSASALSLFDARERLRPSLYTYCLTYAYSVAGEDSGGSLGTGEARRAYPRTRLLSSLPAPGQCAPAALSYCLASCIFVATFLMVVKFPNVVEGSHWVRLSIGTLVVLLLPPVTVMTFRWPTSRLDLYGAVLNLYPAASYDNLMKSWTSRVARGYYIAKFLLPDVDRARKILHDESLREEEERPEVSRQELGASDSSI
ncbi:NACHT domain-containing protein [Streptomyces sp. NPDC058398]|uniref:NACHT domain-containing protein n=1 Tax=Streptomyces sp. NPDC058398 TaxID=3346479 RepID=UPI0036663388